MTFFAKCLSNIKGEGKRPNSISLRLEKILQLMDQNKGPERDLSAPNQTMPKNSHSGIRIILEHKNSDPLPANAGTHSMITGVNKNKCYQIKTNGQKSPSLMLKAPKNKINNSLRVAQWNLRGSKHPSKVHTINGIDCDLFALQEINHIDENVTDNIHKKNILSIKEREIKTIGGGTMTLSELNITHKEEININKDCNLTRIVIDGVFVLWFGNIYLNRGLPKQITKLFSIIQESIPENEMQNLILVGDFNVNINNKSPKLTLLTNLCNQFQLKINDPGKASRYFTTLDYLICGKGIEATIKENLPSCSDHNILIWDVTFKATPKPKKIYIPNKKLAEEITQAAIMNDNVTNATTLLQTFLNLKRLRKKEALLKIKPKRRKNDTYKSILLSIKDESSITEALKNYWSSFWEEVEDMRFSPMSKEAFNMLKTICKYHLYEKRDGSIVNNILGDDGNIITDPKKVSSALIEVLKNIQLSEEFAEYSGTLPFPDLPPLNEDEIKHLLSKLATGKALSFDLFSDMLLKDSKAVERLSKLLQDLWNNDLNKIDSINELFKARLIALNKVHPKTPKSDEFRPIIILSLIVKIMECRWLPKL